MNPMVHNIGESNSNDPPHMVANQLKIFIPVGTAIIMVAAVCFGINIHSYRIHVVSPDNESSTPVDIA